MGTPFDALQHALLGLKGLPPEQRQAWKEIFDFYVFDADSQDFSHIPESRRGVLAPISQSMAKSLRARLTQNLKNIR